MRIGANRVAGSLRAAVVGAGLCGSAWVAGCGRSDPPQPAANPPLPTAEDFLARTGDAVQRAREFEIIAGRIQLASDAAAQKPILRDAFVTLADLLPRLAGPRPSGTFGHQLAVVTQVRDQIAARPGDRPLDPGVVNGGLGATYNVLRDLGYTQFYQDEQLTKGLDALAAQVRALEASTGTWEYPLAVRDAVVSTSGLLTKMATTLAERIDSAGGAATAGPGTGGPATLPGATAPVDPASPATPAVPSLDAPATPATQPAATQPAADSVTPAAPQAPADPAVPPAPPAAPGDGNK